METTLSQAQRRILMDSDPFYQGRCQEVCDLMDFVRVHENVYMLCHNGVFLLCYDVRTEVSDELLASLVPSIYVDCLTLNQDAVCFDLRNWIRARDLMLLRGHIIRMYVVPFKNYIVPPRCEHIAVEDVRDFKTMVYTEDRVFAATAIFSIGCRKLPGPDSAWLMFVLWLGTCSELHTTPVFDVKIFRERLNRMYDGSQDTVTLIGQQGVFSNGYNYNFSIGAFEALLASYFPICVRSLSDPTCCNMCLAMGDSHRREKYFYGDAGRSGLYKLIVTGGGREGASVDGYASIDGSKIVFWPSDHFYANAADFFGEKRTVTLVGESTFSIEATVYGETDYMSHPHWHIAEGDVCEFEGRKLTGGNGPLKHALLRQYNRVMHGQYVSYGFPYYKPPGCTATVVTAGCNALFRCVRDVLKLNRDYGFPGRISKELFESCFIEAGCHPLVDYLTHLIHGTRYSEVRIWQRTWDNKEKRLIAPKNASQVHDKLSYINATLMRTRELVMKLGKQEVSSCRPVVTIGAVLTDFESAQKCELLHKYLVPIVYDQAFDKRFAYVAAEPCQRPLALACFSDEVSPNSGVSMYKNSKYVKELHYHEAVLKHVSVIVRLPVQDVFDYCWHHDIFMSPGIANNYLAAKPLRQLFWAASIRAIVSTLHFIVDGPHCALSWTRFLDCPWECKAIKEVMECNLSNRTLFNNIRTYKNLQGDKARRFWVLMGAATVDVNAKELNRLWCDLTFYRPPDEENHVSESWIYSLDELNFITNKDFDAHSSS